VITGIEAESPAERSGLIVGDVLTGLGGARIDIDDLHAAIARSAAGATIALDVLRGGSPQAITATIGERPASERDHGHHGHGRG
jgi:S1-C subfamily serine protease